ncbi:MAG: lysine--tRNA ligase [Candidatus Thorarchaeota archaeon]|nr:MAG: lysine--tRNA ligase [Candidatus Thorarchaeota archaeon]
MPESVQEEEFSIHWIEDVLQRVLERDVDEYLLSAGKSPSGSIHVGILRELIISDVIKRRLLDLGKKARTMFVIDDYDPVRSFPPGTSLSLDEWVGIPYSDVPDEFGCCESYGAHYANELIETFPKFGIDPEIVWTSKLYRTDAMIEEVRTCLRETETIREIMIEYVARDFSPEQRAQYVDSMKNWYPASVVCPECGRLQAGAKGSIMPNRITAYDPDTDAASFKCHYCGLEDTRPLSQLRVKLTWRIDWPAKWHLFRVTCEPAGKDHSVKGGSYDTGLEVSRRVFGWEGPVKVPYEWVQIGGRDMTTSEGIVFTPRSWLRIAPASLYRFLMLKTDLQRTINIQPDRIPDLVDQYDRFERTYYALEDADSDRERLARLLYPLCEAQPVREEYVPKLSFKFAVVISQLEELLGHDVVVQRCVEAMKRQFGVESLPDESMSNIEQRLKMALNWVREYGTKRDRVEVPPEVPAATRQTLTDKDKEFLSVMVEALRRGPASDEDIQAAVFEAARSVGLKEKRAFVVMYRLLISRKSGPRLGPFINLLGREWVADRIASVL